MSIGSSGRIVIEVDPELKRALHLALRRKGTNLKVWFVENANEFLNASDPQTELPFAKTELRGTEGTR